MEINKINNTEKHKWGTTLCSCHSRKRGLTLKQLQKKKSKQKQNQTYNCAVLDRRGKGCFMNS